MTLSSLIELSFWIPLLAAGVRVATPLVFASLGEAVSERAGILNVGIEGMMALGAIVGFLVAYWSGHSWVGLLAAAMAGLVASLIFGFLTIFRGADQIVTGIVMNILLLGLASFAYASIFSSAHVVAQLTAIPVFRVPWLSDLPIIGRPFFAQSRIVYAVYLLIPVFWLLLEHSHWGLSVRAAPILLHDARNFVQFRRKARGVPSRAVKGYGKTMRFISYDLHEVQDRRELIQLNRVIHVNTIAAFPTHVDRHNPG